jgi:CRISPR-associated endonuclease Cas2
MDRVHGFFICYDIRHPQRLRKVHRLVKRYAHQLQESVYYCQVKTSVMSECKLKLEALIDQQIDDVRIYQLRHRSPIYWMGRPIQADGILDFSLPFGSDIKTNMGTVG